MIRLSVPAIGDEECQAVERVLRTGQLVHGEECELLERELAAYLGCSEVVVVSSGTAALHLALIALGIGPGDAVLVPDYTFVATANVVELVGARPVFVDVDGATYNMTPETIRLALEGWQGTETIRAIMPVHEFGCPADMTGIIEIAREQDLLVIEDAACGLGATHNGAFVGTFGQAGCFSFHPRKALTTGEGGAVATNDVELAERVRCYRNHGIQRNANQQEFVAAGYNYRLTNFQAALGRVQLPKFPGWLAEREQLQQLYRDGLKNSGCQLPAEVPGHAWQTFMVRLPSWCERKDIVSRLKEKGIEANLGAQAIHAQQYYQGKYADMCKAAVGNHAEALFTHGLALPLYQGLAVADVKRVIQALTEMLSSK